MQADSGNRIRSCCDGPPMKKILMDGDPSSILNYEYTSPDADRHRKMKNANGRTRLAAGIMACLLVGMCSQCARGEQMHEGNALLAPARYRTVIIIQSYYHTGILLELDAETRGKLDLARYFIRYRNIDIGWGEEVFYQDPSFTLSKGARAVLCPSRSVIRAEGFNQDIDDVVGTSDRAMRFRITDDQYDRLCAFINASLTRNVKGEAVVVSSHDSGAVLFFKSPHTYCLFNTCNTWIAKALKRAGIEISPACVVTASTLFSRLKKKGDSLK